MSSSEKRELILRVDQLIRMKVNGSACVLAHRLNISRSTFFRLLDDMKYNLNAPITYCKCNQRYIYEKEGCVNFGFVTYEELKQQGLQLINGGNITDTNSVIGNNFWAVSFFETNMHQLYQRFN